MQTLEINSQAEIEGVTVNKFDPRAGAEASYSKLRFQSIILKDPNVVLVSQIPDSQTADLITRYTGESACWNPIAFIRRCLHWIPSRHWNSGSISTRTKRRPPAPCA